MSAASGNGAEDAGTRLRRLRMRSWRRGMREMDLLLGPFGDAALADLGAQALDDYEAMLEENDQDLYLWLSRGQGAPAQYAEIVRTIRRHHRIG